MAHCLAMLWSNPYTERERERVRARVCVSVPHKFEAVGDFGYLENVKKEKFAVNRVSSLRCSLCTQGETLQRYTLYTLSIKKLRQSCQCDM
jgi:hypothetical protein